MGHPVAVLKRLVPIFPVSDLDSAVEHYQRLGFEVRLYEGGGYAYVSRDDVQLHLRHVAELVTADNTSGAYLYVEDADALFEEWRSVRGHAIPPNETPWGLREGAHVDPDGNLIRFGSPL
jgi:uncharacterized glyoxalase superfamily protein PhnB